MFLFVVVFSLSVGFTFVLYFVARYVGNRAALGLSAAATFLSFCVIMLPLSGHFFVCSILLLGAALKGAKPRVAVFCSIAGMVVSYSLVAFNVRSTMNELESLQKDYPIVSLEGRLAYEQKATEAGESPELSAQVQNQLERFEEMRDFGQPIRTEMLELLHGDLTQEFAAAQGFGVGRMMRIRRGPIELPKLEPVPQPKPTKQYKPNQPDPATPIDEIVFEPPGEGALGWINEYATEDFLDIRRMGYIESRQRAAGFKPHQMSVLPHNDNDGWSVIRVELISLLRHEEAVAYVSDHLPDMNELVNVPTRSLTDFEKSALKKLRAEQDVVIDERVNRIRMVGSIRASNDCLKCHSVSRGDLLGAFSYAIEPDTRTRSPSPLEFN